MAARSKQVAALGRTLVACGVALVAATQAAEAWARAGRASGHANGHGGHFARGFGIATWHAPRTAYFAAPFAYFPSTYYSAPPAYYYPSAYYEPSPPAAYYQGPVQSAPPPPPPVGYYAPPPPASYSPPAVSAGPQAPIYYCKDARGATSITNVRSDTAGKVCSESPNRISRGPDAVASEASRYRHYCPDTKKYFPDAKKCASAWLKVVPDS